MLIDDELKKSKGPTHHPFPSDASPTPSDASIASIQRRDSPERHRPAAASMNTDKNFDAYVMDIPFLLPLPLPLSKGKTR